MPRPPAPDTRGSRGAPPTRYDSDHERSWPQASEHAQPTETATGQRRTLTNRMPNGPPVPDTWGSGGSAPGWQEATPSEAGRRPASMRNRAAGVPGLEPRLTGPDPAGLPL